MRNIDKQIQSKYLVLFFIFTVIILLSSYAYIKEILLDSSNDINMLLSTISIVFFILGIFLILLSIGVFYILKKQNDKLVEDTTALSEYILDISEKDYKSSLKIKYYSEFLQMSISLKNIVKRLTKKK